MNTDLQKVEDNHKPNRSLDTDKIASLLLNAITAENRATIRANADQELQMKEKGQIEIREEQTIQKDQRKQRIALC